MSDMLLATAPRFWQLGLSPHCRTAQPSLPALGSRVPHGSSLLLTLMNEILQARGRPQRHKTPAVMPLRCFTQQEATVPATAQHEALRPGYSPATTPASCPGGRRRLSTFILRLQIALLGLQDCSAARAIPEEL